MVFQTNFKIVVVKNGVVQRISPFSQVKINDGETPIIVQKDTPVSHGYVLSNGAFSPNPKQPEIELAEAKKKEFLASIQSSTSLEELKAVISAADSEINKG